VIVTSRINSIWNIPSTSSVHSLEWTLKILFDINLVNAFVAWLIHPYVLYWKFTHVTYDLHLLVTFLSFLGLSMNNLLNSIKTFWSTHWATFWTNFLIFRISSWIQCPLISCILVWFKPCSCLSKTLKSTS